MVPFNLRCLQSQVAEPVQVHEAIGKHEQHMRTWDVAENLNYRVIDSSLGHMLPSSVAQTLGHTSSSYTYGAYCHLRGKP